MAEAFSCPTGSGGGILNAADTSDMPYYRQNTLGSVGKWFESPSDNCLLVGSAPAQIILGATGSTPPFHANGVGVGVSHSDSSPPSRRVSGAKLNPSFAKLQSPTGGVVGRATPSNAHAPPAVHGPRYSGDLKPTTPRKSKCGKGRNGVDRASSHAHAAPCTPSKKSASFRGPPHEHAEVKTPVGQRGRDRSDTPGQGNANNANSNGGTPSQKHRNPPGKAASPPPGNSGRNGGGRKDPAGGGGRRATASSAAHAHDLSIDKKSTVAKHPYGLKGNQRGFGGVYKNRRTKIILVPGETILKTVNCTMLLPSQTRMVSIRFIVTNYRVGMKLLEAPVPRAITVPLAHIEKIKSRSIAQGTDILARSRSPSPGPRMYVNVDREGRSHSPGHAHGSPFIRTRSPHEFGAPMPGELMGDAAAAGESSGSIGRFAPAVGGWAGSSSKTRGSSIAQWGSVPSSIHGDDAAAQFDRGTLLRATSPKRDRGASRDRDAAGGGGGCEGGDTPSGSGGVGKRGAQREGMLLIQTKGVQMYSVQMRLEDSVIVQKLLHNLPVNNPAGSRPFCTTTRNAARKTAPNAAALDAPNDGDIVAQEFERFMATLPPHLRTHWRLSDANAAFALAASYPERNIVPTNALDALIQQVSEFRTKNRFPVVSWIHPDTGATINRSSQPKVGFGGKRSNHDEMYVSMLQRPKADPVPPQPLGDEDESGSQEGSDSASQGQPVGRKERPKGLVILDCRPFANAVANRSRAGGYEDERYYHGCAYDNADLGNIHEVTSSMKALRRLMEAPLSSSSSGGWSAAFLSTAWTRHIEKIILAALRVVGFVEQGQSVLVHCSDGWDRTSQVVSLAKLLLDPYYRTIDGFQALLRFDWLAAGHKFADRHYNAESDANKSECSPIFLQWCDCVWQVWRQYPSMFEFSDQFLIYILQHSTSGRFATFLHNNIKERRAAGDIGISFWLHLNTPEQRYHRPEFLNILYAPSATVIRPSNWPRLLHFWEEVHAQLDYEWSDLWSEPISDRLMQIGREVEMHRVKGPKLEAALRKRMDHLNSFATVKHLASLVDSKQGVVDMMRQLLEDEVLTRVFERIDVIESHSIQQLLEDTVLTRVFDIIDVIEAQHNRDAGVTIMPSEKQLGAVARWVPDNMAPICAACLLPFKWYRRRHHCRFCGHVFCMAHSTQRRELPDRPQAGQVRVCDDCAQLLDRAARSPRPLPREQNGGAGVANNNNNNNTSGTIGDGRVLSWPRAETAT